MSGFDLFHAIFNFCFNPIFNEFLAMKYWLSHLPLEVWVDVFCYPWRSREEISQLVDRIGNYQFAEYLQFYLHDWGKRKLENYLNCLKNHVSKCKDSGIPPYYYLDYPQTPLPMNIKSFECVITIENVDVQPLNFLRILQPILTNVNLQIWFQPTNMEDGRIILANLVSLIDRICSFECYSDALPTVKQCFGEKLAKLEELKLNHSRSEGMETRQTTVNFLMDWLTSPASRQNGPKFYKAYIPDDNVFGPQIIKAIREQFLVANHPSTFTVVLIPFNLDWQWDEFHLQNNNTGEQLRGKRLLINLGYGVPGCFQITRRLANCGAELQDWLNGFNAGTRPRTITVFMPPNRLDASIMAALEDGEKEDQKPSTSKES